MRFVQRSLAIIYASTTGNTEFVIDTLIARIEQSTDVRVLFKQRAEQTKREDLLKGDILLLASGSWNTGGIEGQLNPHMHALLTERAADMKLAKKPCVVVGLGDDRYYYTARAADYLTDFILSHDGNLLLPALMVINEPYDQVEKIDHFTDELLSHIDKLPVSVHTE